MNFFRRSGAQILRTIAQSLDPASETDHVLLYSKNLGDIPQYYACSTDGVRLISGIEKNIWDRPLVAHAFDDEFDTTTLDPAWVQNQGTWVQGGIDPYAAITAPGNTRYEIHTDRRPSWLMAQVPSATGVRLTKVTVLPTNCLVWSRMSFSCRLNVAPVNNDNNIALVLSTNPFDNNNNLKLSLNEQDAGTIQLQWEETEGGVNTLISNSINKWNGALADLQTIEAIAIHKVGTTYHAWAFGSNGTAIYQGSTTFAPAIGTTSIELATTSTVAPGNMLFGIDFVRFKDSATYLP